MRRAAIGALLLALAACSPGQPYHPPALPVAPNWRASVGQATIAPISAPWWRGFGDPALDSLETRALGNNLTIEQALARVDQAGAAARTARAALLPSGEVSGAVSANEQTLNAGTGQISRYVSFYPRSFTEETVGIGTSWDLDFAGGLKRKGEAARADLEGARAGLAAARIAVAAELADAYARWCGLRMQLAEARALVGLLKDQTGIMAVRLRTGAASAQAADAGEARLAEETAQAATLTAMVETQRDRIAVLIGQPPANPIAELDTAAPRGAITAPPTPLLGLPARVLRQRPDVAMAEARLIAAHAGVRASLAEYYPKLSFAGVLGLDSDHVSTLATGDSLFGQAALGLHWRLFDFVRIDAEVRAARGREREALAAYREAVLRASEEVETSFARLAAAHDRVAAYARAGAAIAHSLAASSRAYAAGSLSRDGLINGQRDAVAVDTALAGARQEENQATIACYRALGV